MNYQDFEKEFDVDLELQPCYCCGEFYPSDSLVETDTQFLCDLCFIAFDDDCLTDIGV